MKRKAEFLILLLINVVLIVIFLSLVVVLGDNALSEDARRNISLGKVILGLIIGIGGIVVSVYYMKISLTKAKKLSIYGNYSNLHNYKWKSLFIVFLLISYSVFFIVTSLFLNTSPESQESYFFRYQVLYILTMTFTVSIFFIIGYYQYLKNNIVPKWEETIRFGSLIENRNRIPIRELRGYFQGDKEFYDKLLRWVEQFNLSIEVDAIILNEETIDEFMKSLDDLYREWNS